MRCARASACVSSVGVHASSTNSTVLAAVRVIPVCNTRHNQVRHSPNHAWEAVRSGRSQNFGTLLSLNRQGSQRGARGELSNLHLAISIGDLPWESQPAMPDTLDPVHGLPPRKCLNWRTLSFCSTAEPRMGSYTEPDQKLWPALDSQACTILEDRWPVRRGSPRQPGC